MTCLKWKLKMSIEWDQKPNGNIIVMDLNVMFVVVVAIICVISNEFQEALYRVGPLVDEVNDELNKHLLIEPMNGHTNPLLFFVSMSLKAVRNTWSVKLIKISSPKYPSWLHSAHSVPCTVHSLHSKDATTVFMGHSQFKQIVYSCVIADNIWWLWWFYRLS